MELTMDQIKYLIVLVAAILAAMRFRQMFQQGKRLPSRQPAGAFTVQDVARAYGVSLREVRRWIGDGGLVAVRLGNVILIREDDLARFLEEHRDHGFGQREPAPAMDAWPEPVPEVEPPRAPSPGPPMEEHPDSPFTSPTTPPEPPEFPPWTPLYEPRFDELDLMLMDLPCN